MVTRRKTTLLKIRYNAPVTLTFSFIAIGILLVNQLLLRHLIPALFAVPGKYDFHWNSALDYMTLFTHVLGHADWNHLVSNLSFILLLGPMLEQRYGSPMLLLMIAVTAFVTGVLNVCFLSTGLMGASGIAFMMILLASFTNIEKNEIPLTFILIVFLYLGREVINIFNNDNVSEFAHLAGGICGSMFGFFTPNPSRRQPAGAVKRTQKGDPYGKKLADTAGSAESAESLRND